MKHDNHRLRMRSIMNIPSAWLLVALALILCAGCSRSESQAQNETAPREARLVNVAVMEVTPEPMKDVLVLPGETEAWQDVLVAADTVGRVEWIGPKEGDTVKKGQLLAKIDVSALRAALREDPDIVLVGEMRDLETVAIALETAETGHLVFGTLHTSSAISTVDRLIDQFPADQQEQIRVMLAESLKAVLAQVLCRKKGGGRVAALEVLMGIPAVSNLIREAKTFQLASIMQTGRKHGMIGGVVRRKFQSCIGLRVLPADPCFSAVMTVAVAAEAELILAGD